MFYPPIPNWLMLIQDVPDQRVYPYHEIHVRKRKTYYCQLSSNEHPYKRDTKSWPCLPWLPLFDSLGVDIDDFFSVDKHSSAISPKGVHLRDS